MSQAVIIFIALIVGWLIQLAFSYFQTKRFHDRLTVLKRRGQRTAVGFAGSNWRRKVYAVLVVDDLDNIVCAEQLSGWTVFAKLKPVDALVGLPVEALSEDRAGNIPEKIWRACQNAAGYLAEDNQQATQTELPAGYKVS